MDSVIIHNSLTLKMTEEGNDYLHDSYHGPVDKEITAIDLKVTGQIPLDLQSAVAITGLMEMAWSMG
jgi:carotenoid cleavage dioxygenase-like enzyme